METRVRKRGRRTIRSCTSPQSSLPPHPIFNWYEDDLWTEIAKFLPGTCLVNLGLTNRWFHRIILRQDCVWKFACFRDLQLPLPRPQPQPSCLPSFKWIQLYASAFDGSHSYLFRQPEKHIDWMRIGAFLFDSPIALLTERLSLPPKIPLGVDIDNMLQTTSSCILNNIRPGIWIADLQLVRCPVCNLDTCEGTMQTLDTRHIELFLSNGYKDGSWEYKEIGAHEVKKHSEGATSGVFDIKHIRDPSTTEVLNLKLWAAKPNDWQPKARIALHAVAVNTNLQQNDGLNVKYQAMRSGADGEVVSIRISQQLL